MRIKTTTALDALNISRFLNSRCDTKKVLADDCGNVYWLNFDAVLYFEITAEELETLHQIKKLQVDQSEQILTFVLT